MNDQALKDRNTPATRPFMTMHQLGSSAQPEAPTVESLAAKHRELMDAFGDIPQRLNIACRDAARKTNATPQWERVGRALYALIGDPD